MGSESLELSGVGHLGLEDFVFWGTSDVELGGGGGLTLSMDSSTRGPKPRSATKQCSLLDKLVLGQGLLVLLGFTCSGEPSLNSSLLD